MKNLTRFFFVLCLMLIAKIACATEPVLVSEPVTDGEFWTAVFNFISGIKGATTIAVVAALIQLLLLGVNTKYGEGLGKFKLLAVSFLSLAGVFVGLLIQGVSASAAIFSGATLAAFQVFAHQFYKQFIERQPENTLQMPKF